MALSSAPTRRQGELGMAVALFAAAAFTWTEARNYPGMSGTYPQVLSVMLGLGALALGLRTLRQHDAEGASPLFTHLGRCILGFAAMAVYIVAIDLLGYILPSLALAVTVPLLLGYRNLRLIVSTAFGVLAFILLVFIVILERPLPADVFDSILEVLR